VTGQPAGAAPLRVAHLVRAIFPQHGYGGMERAATALTDHMLRAGADVTLFTRTWPGLGDRPALAPGEQGACVVGVPYSVLPLRPNSILARLTNYPLFVERMGRAVGNRPVAVRWMSCTRTACAPTACAIRPGGRRRAGWLRW
jgi:hypothetical protein